MDKRIRSSQAGEPAFLSHSCKYPAENQFENRFQQLYGFARIEIGVEPGWPVAPGQSAFQTA
jgi:hypothetical protein